MFWGPKGCLGAPKQSKIDLKRHFKGHDRLIPSKELIFSSNQLARQGGCSNWLILTSVDQAMGPLELFEGSKTAQN